MTEVCTQTEQSPSSSSFIVVCGGDETKSEEAVELPLENDGTLAISTLQLEFSSAAGLKYKNPDTGLMRFLKPDKAQIAPPPEGWGNYKYIACVVKAVPLKRPASVTSTSNGPLAKVTKIVVPTANPVETDKPAVTSPSTTGTIQSADDAPVISNPTGTVYTNATTFRNANDSTDSSTSVSANGSNTQSSCNICNVTMNSISQMQHHYEGKRHKDMVMIAQRGRGVPSRGVVTRGAPTRGLPLTRPSVMRGMPVVRAARAGGMPVRAQGGMHTRPRGSMHGSPQGGMHMRPRGSMHVSPQGGMHVRLQGGMGVRPQGAMGVRHPSGMATVRHPGVMQVRRPIGGPMNRGGGRPMVPMRGRGFVPVMSPQMRHYRPNPPPNSFPNASFANDDWAFSGFNDFSGSQGW